LRIAIISAALLLVACGPEALSQNGVPGQTLSINVGQTLDLKLQTIGSGEYASPPEISSDAIRFVGVSLLGPAVPAGPIQQFRFQAMARGLAVIAFRHTGQNPMVKDTVEVR
jgi:hypothetical protein